MQKISWITPVWIGSAVFLGGCAGGGSTVLGPTPPSSVSPVGSAPATPAARTAGSPAAAGSAHSLATITSWTQPDLPLSEKPSAALAELTAEPATLLIVDPAALAPPSGQHGKPASPVQAIQQGGKRKVVALLSIGDLRTTDPLWQPAWVDRKGKLTPKAPSWLEPAGGGAGQYPVQFWNADWQKQVHNSVNGLVRAGYDGVCLEGIGDFKAAEKSHPAAAHDMAAFVESLAGAARQKNKSFSVISDDGTDLPGALPSADAKAYDAALDGVVAHDVFYPGNKPADNDLLPSADTLSALDEFQKAGIPVFATERLTDPAKIADFLTRAKAKGYIPDSAMTPPPPAAPVDPRVADVR